MGTKHGGAHLLHYVCYYELHRVARNYLGPHVLPTLTSDQNVFTKTRLTTRSLVGPATHCFFGKVKMEIGIEQQFYGKTD